MVSSEGFLFGFYSDLLWYNEFAMQRGIATFTLDYGKCPRWLFERMVKLGREMTEVLVDEYGSDEFVRRIGDPVWFQSLGTVLAFDWNASGLTTILTAALKEAIRGQENDLEKELAKKYKAIYVDNILKGIISDPKLMADSIHPNSVGYQKIAARLAEVLKPII